MKMDPDNFTKDQVDGYVLKAEEFIQEIFSDWHLMYIMEQTVNKTPEETSTVDTTAETGKVPEVDLLSSMDLDESTLLLYSEFVKDSSEEKKTADEPQNANQDLIDKRKNELKAAITRSVQDYFYYCRKTMDVVLDLEIYGNERYMKEKKNIDFNRIRAPINDPYYAYKYFDLMKWWKQFGSSRWPMISVVAAIVLGKPSHNGFQERVFSRGTHRDDKLKQRLLDQNFEMSVLNSLTNTKLTEVMKSINRMDGNETKYDENKRDINSFFANEKNYEKLCDALMIEEVDASVDGASDTSAIASEDEDGINDNINDDELSINTEMEIEDDLGPKKVINTVVDLMINNDDN
jgi:hypothetical protein